jgi:hypothetical protein
MSSERVISCLHLIIYNALEIYALFVQGGSNMTGTDFFSYKPHCAAAVRP